ncbi:unnamed protein product [Macrosiphum euphorbiae]|uniref:DDE Tnp4 domain-containing protein n=1 Tax=Macrosiphum euphorbiae TaxID=13131 RepID=A0AAV0Y6V8_9HEMI|nr:unnamed protein product [Macrosiphum euphorbiae]
MLYHITVFSRLSTIIPKGCVFLIKMDCGSSSSSSGWEEELEAVAAFVVLDEEENKTKTREWVHAINKKRETLGEFHRLVPELKKDTKRYHMYFRMTMEEFDFLHELIKPDIYKQNTQFRRAVSTEERLAVCLRFLATGNSFRSIGFNYRLGFSTVREIVKEVCDAIWNRLGPIVMPPPTEEMWKNVAAKYKKMWHFPNCIGAIDGKHINIQCPINAGSTYYNYKGSHSVVLLALVDADYKFIAMDVGSYGRNSDGGIFSQSVIGQKLNNKTLNVPEPAPLTENGDPQPYVIVGDEAFPIKRDNEPNKIFNYRLSRARRVVENAFGILAARWRCFRGHLEVQPEFVDKIVLASCCLHNMLCADNVFEPDNESLQLPEAAVLNLDPLRRNSTREAFQVERVRKGRIHS